MSVAALPRLELLELQPHAPACAEERSVPTLIEWVEGLIPAKTPSGLRKPMPPLDWALDLVAALALVAYLAALGGLVRWGWRWLFGE